MRTKYDEYYLTQNYFGEPYPELIEFYSKIQTKGKLLDLGCGQGRDAIALAKLGYEVTGIDHSEVGIQQLNKIAQEENLPVKGIVGDIYEFSDFVEFEFILLDSMFHFGKSDKDKESKLLQRIIEFSKDNALITICIQDSGKKTDVLNSIISKYRNLEEVSTVKFDYIFENKDSDHCSKSRYEMISIRKLKT